MKLKREMRSSGNNRKFNSCPYLMDKSLMDEFESSCSATQEIHKTDNFIAPCDLLKVNKRLDVLNNVITPNCL